MFLLVAVRTVAIRLPTGDLPGDWVHTLLHLGTATVAFIVSRMRVRLVWSRVFTWSVLAVYGVLGVIGWFVDGVMMRTWLRVPLGVSDTVFHLLVAAGALATVRHGHRHQRRVREAAIPIDREPSSPVAASRATSSRRRGIERRRMTPTLPRVTRPRDRT